MTRAADPTSVLCKRYSMYEPGKRVARGWNASRRTSGESRDERTRYGVKEIQREDRMLAGG